MMSNSAPGKDRVEYRHLRVIDPKGELLASIFGHCIRQRDVPDIWKTATTILIHKKGPTDDVSNFRPIALMSCIYKLLMGLLARRISKWAIENALLSEEQKSARPTEGCYEHGFLLQSVIGDTRRTQKNVFVAWLDLRNAFGSVPHDAIFTTLTHMGFPPDLVNMIRNAYTNATTEIRTNTGITNAIPIHAGVKQGCPMSPVLFNLALELVLRKIKAASESCWRGPARHHTVPISVIAYADDLVLLARQKQSLQHLLDAASSAATTIGLEFRPDKSASLSLVKSKRAEHQDEPVQRNIFTIQNNQIPSLGAEDHYRYLGVPIGLLHNIDNLPELVDKLIPKLIQIQESLLAPWQKLDAIRTFVQPCLTYALRAGAPKKQSLTDYRATLLRVIRKICDLPNRATTNYIFASRRTGGLGFQDPLRECDVQTIVQAIRILSSTDPTIAAIARAELLQTVQHAAQSLPTPALVANYLSAAPDDRLNNIRYRVQSLWTRTRKAARNLKVSFRMNDLTAPTIASGDAGPANSKQACYFLHNLIQDQYADALSELNDQGKVARALYHDQYANSSSWQFTGLNIRFKDWRFIHKARLNCLSLNAVKSRWSDTSPKCRHCPSTETLPHVLDHCTTNMVLIRQRHDKVIERLTNAVRFGDITTDRCVAESGSRLCPDIVITEGNQVSVIDVCCPFENGAEALAEAELQKVEKYLEIKQHFLSLGMQCNVYGFVIGALGTWHPNNEQVLRCLGMTRSYKNLFRKLCCTDVIQGSTNIYRQHLGCDQI